MEEILSVKSAGTKRGKNMDVKMRHCVTRQFLDNMAYHANLAIATCPDMELESLMDNIQVVDMCGVKIYYEEDFDDTE